MTATIPCTVLEHPALERGMKNREHLFSLLGRICGFPKEIGMVARTGIEPVFQP